MILGAQRRTISCFWSNRSCLGYDNKQEEEQFCSYGDFFQTFCGDWRFGKISCKTKGGITEKERIFFTYEHTDRNDMTNIVKRCDSPKKWTLISVERDIYHGKYYRLRLVKSFFLNYLFQLFIQFILPTSSFISTFNVCV